MRAIVYNTETGEIAREINGNVKRDREVIKPNQELLSIDPSVALEGKRVDPETEELVDDPEYSEPPRKTVKRDKVSEQSKQEYRNASSVEEKCDILFEILTGEQP